MSAAATAGNGDDVAGDDHGDARGLVEAGDLVESTSTPAPPPRALHPRHGVAFRPLEDAPLIEVWLVWWKDDVPPLLDDLVEISRAAYARASC